MNTQPDSRAVRVDGEVLVLHCWACGCAHCVDLELCVPRKLSHMVCSNTKCRMSLFLVNELVVDYESSQRMAKDELTTRATHPKFR